MTRSHTAVLFLAAGVFAAGVRASGDQLPEIIEDIDELYRSSSSHGEVSMRIVTQHWERTLEMEVWSEGMEKTLIRIEAPKKEEGVGTLRIGNEMWNYLPKTNKVIKIPPSMMMSEWMGSDFTNDDLVKEYTFLEDYEFELTTVDDPEPGLVYIRALPKEDRPIVWGHVTIAAREEDHIPMWQKYYDEHGELMRTLRYSNVKELGGRRLPATLEMVPENEEGKTVVTYESLEFDVDLDEKIFTLRNLRTPG